MKKYSILLCCGAGMSSGLIAQQARKAAKKQGMDVSVDARSESEVDQYLPSIDCLLLGPHYVMYLDEMTERAKPYNVPVGVISKDAYSMMDGEAVLKMAMELIEKSEK